MKLLVKIATRSRPKKIVDILQKYVATISNHDQTSIVVSYDDDDITMDADVVAQCSAISPMITMVSGMSLNKIDACNRDVPADGWDVLILGSDDMVPMVNGWDEIVRVAMHNNYPDTDGCLWFNDGHQPRICTYSIIGKKYYDRFGYIYQPEYTSLWCDNEYTEVAQRDLKITYSDIVLFFHDHPMWTNERHKMDAQYRFTESFYTKDREVYMRRKKLGFP